MGTVPVHALIDTYNSSLLVVFWRVIEVFLRLPAVFSVVYRAFGAQGFPSNSNDFNDELAKL
jgi:hypothetical protein